MSLMSAIRRVAGAKGKARTEDENPEDAEDEDQETEAEENREDPDGEEDEVDNHAEDENDDPDAEDDETEAKDEEEEKEAKKMTAAQRSAFAKGRRAERRRISKILGSRAAEANPTLAAHLAFGTSDKASKALSTLKAGGAAAVPGLAGKMSGRTSRTGRGGEQARGDRSASGGWGKALAKAGVAAKARRP